ncbi:MAG: GNAT family N-acetyltransferase [Actinobacteria bacterium]|nr:GNAT family N-acetyltransferase [Actinomycetota bacterium]
MDGVRIVEARPERVVELEPLYAALHEQHRAVDPQIPGVPMRDTDGAWPRRRANYEQGAREPGAFLLLAIEDGDPVGYAMVRERAASEGWATSEICAELESIAVLPSHRGRGIGSRLLEAVHERLRERGIRELYVEVLATNEAAERFYARHGLIRWTVTLLGRVPEPPDAPS